jgi:hypothetical protein
MGAFCHAWLGTSGKLASKHRRQCSVAVRFMNWWPIFSETNGWKTIESFYILQAERIALNRCMEQNQTTERRPVRMKKCHGHQYGGNFLKLTEGE